MHSITTRQKWKAAEGGIRFETGAEKRASSWKEASEALAELLTLDLKRAQEDDAFGGTLEQVQMYQCDHRSRADALEATFYGRYRAGGESASLTVTVSVEGPDIGKSEVRSFKNRCTRFLNEYRNGVLTGRGFKAKNRERKEEYKRGLAQQFLVDNGVIAAPLMSAPETTEPDTCPCCSSGDVEMVDIAFERGAMHVEMACATCGESYVEEYSFAKSVGYARLSHES